MLGCISFVNAYMDDDSRYASFMSAFKKKNRSFLLLFCLFVFVFFFFHFVLTARIHSLLYH